MVCTCHDGGLYVRVRGEINGGTYHLLLREKDRRKGKKPNQKNNNNRQRKGNDTDDDDKESYLLMTMITKKLRTHPFLGLGLYPPSKITIMEDLPCRKTYQAYE